MLFARFRTLLLLLLGVAMFIVASGQKNHVSKLFYQLNTSHGLSDNYVRSMAVDKRGTLWVGTGEGLNSFNGKSVVKYFAQQYPALRYDYISQLVCDNNNRLWALTAFGHVTMIDEHRQFRHVGLYEDSLFIPVIRMVEMPAIGVVLITAKGHFRFTGAVAWHNATDSLDRRNFERLEIRGMESIDHKGVQQCKPVSASSCVISNGKIIYQVNYAANAVTHQWPAAHKTLLCSWDTASVLLYDRMQMQLEILDLQNGTVYKTFENIGDQYGHALQGPVLNAMPVDGDQFMIATEKQGLYTFNRKTSQLNSYRHHAADPTTIVNNMPYEMAADENGWVFIGCTPHGVSYFNQRAVVGQKTLFADDKGNSYDGFVSNMTSMDGDTWYLSTGNNLIAWTRSTDKSVFVPYYGSYIPPLVNNAAVTNVSADSRGRLWVSATGHGVFVYDPVRQTSTRLKGEAARLALPATGPVSHTAEDKAGYMWLSCMRGLYRVHTVSLQRDPVEDTLMKALAGVYCIRTWFAPDGAVWVATVGKGLFKYYPFTDRLTQYHTGNGFPSNNVYSINQDTLGNVYAATEEGLYIFLRNGGAKTVTLADGLLNKRIEALMLDSANRMWMGNDVGLACFNIADSSLKVFDERYGLSIQGFLVNAYAHGKNDEQFWGTERGLQYFYPGQLYAQQIRIPTTIHRIETKNLATSITGNESFALAAGDNSVTLYFSSVDYSTHLRTFYRYKLQGLDKDWTRITDQYVVRYSLLPPGTYSFQVGVSNDGKQWSDAENRVTITIAQPWWKQGWFRLAGIAAGLFLIWYVVNYFRRKQQRERAVLESELVINYFASQINRHQNTEDILWDVAGNCISRLHFEDCVIYLLDEDRQVLVQKAAHGPKARREFSIHEPIEIPVGKGIVGTVAQTGKPELINNTELDARYVVDDARRFSELAVPMMVNGKVMGVIDSEHPKKHFFTQEHLRILSTIAVLCANQIERAQAEQDKQEARIEALKNKQKAMESKLQSLRLQMNPHFLFNALNSIQQMILAKEELVATRYLSRFSKLLRAILVHSDKEWVTLKEETDMLQLYVELESVRFKESFQHHIRFPDDMEIDEIKIPTLLIQPFVENAIWHGLMHKDGDKSLTISFEDRETFIACIIEDNGIGREKSAAISQSGSRDKKHVSKGIQVSVERLQSLSAPNGHYGSIQIIDLKDAHGQAQGTRVEILIPA